MLEELGPLMQTLLGPLGGFQGSLQGLRDQAQQQLLQRFGDMSPWRDQVIRGADLRSTIWQRDDAG
ncbi:hypothetical protein AB0H49_04705 [Nocardia sp. NPDC050713]|uniref:hypothetical protein n=1 Tax=Nocardia sp. NPDC050713 TaxID=3154511 RepID=UPI0033F2904A